MTKPQPQNGMWVIGYGSLIFKPPPHVSLKITGYLQGYIRRFWQSSIDHRGTPASPGRVVTLISLDELRDQKRFFHSDLHTYELKNGDIVDIDHSIDDLKPQDLKVWGCAYYIDAEHVDEVKEYLDIREQNGYELRSVKFYIKAEEGGGCDDGRGARVEGSGVPEADRQNDEFGDFIHSSIYIGGLDLDSFIGPEPIEQTASIIKSNVGPSGKNSEYLIKLTHAVRELNCRDYYLEDLLKLIQEE
ncbi:hypothetical protein KGF57_001440 [Candida theae]|uniref:glutathione-specific gamma-glutamylcyclotransferase n=1 Tax=Candida theae TaxID=1198502 RepID=A0AAD5BGY2_9ASCO|nr:uncharacterized protein KGF57_001440 [Candida theae]KAI5962706.1 hypothetical protein KGF57_001440 [Candida theae]